MKLVTFKADDDLVAGFDVWCKAHGLSRTEALREFMADPRRRRARPGPLPLIQVLCEHPKKKRQVHGWGVTCGDCGLRVG